MTFALTPSQPIVDSVTQITASTFNYWRASLAQAIDGAGGSNGTPYTPSTQIGIGGAGLLLTGPTALELSATSVVTQDAGGEVFASGAWTYQGAVSFIGDTVLFNKNFFNVPATCAFVGTSQLNIGDPFGTLGAGQISIAQDSTLSMNGVSGHPAWMYLGQYAGITLQGSAATLNVGDTGSNGTGLINVNKDSYIQLFGTSGHPAQLVAAEFSVISIGDGTHTGNTLQVLSGNTFLAQANSGFDIVSGCTATIALDHTCSLVMAASSTCTLGGTNTLSGPTTASNLASTTQTGPFLKSGAGARTGLRYAPAGTFTQDQNNTMDFTQWDIVDCGNGGSPYGAARTWKLSAPGGGVSCATVTFNSDPSFNLTVVGGSGGSTILIFHDSAGNQIAHVTQPSSGSGTFSLTFFWTAQTDWTPMSGTEPFGNVAQP